MTLRKTLLTFLLLLPLAMSADALDDLQQLFASKPQVQEKIYIHTDNNCYFLGDTLWYKAYVVRADNLKPTNYSKYLYVELLSPDGYVVERQHIPVSANGATCGQFALTDTLYSGFYEVRAYTRWQLNFNVTHKDYTTNDRLKFYGVQAAADFFRDFEGLYSRVFPVYQKPNTVGDFSERYMSKRPKQRVLKEHKALYVTFYPEGGHLVKGLSSNVAFEVKDNNGELIDIEGTLSDGRTVKTSHLGKGEFNITPQGSSTALRLHWNDRDWSFPLPKAEESGATVAYNTAKHSADIRSKGISAAAYMVMCRGKLIKFERISGNATVQLSGLPTGINELIVYDTNAQPLASRLFFVNNNDYSKPLQASLTTVADGGTVGKTTTIAPYAAMQLQVSSDVPLPTVSISVHDAQTDEPGYDDGNIMTDMLLSSELKGFIPYPAQYFPVAKSGKEPDAATLSKAAQNLDLLMKVQGWRRYKRQKQLRYLPERRFTFEGTVLTIPDIASIALETDFANAGKKAYTTSDVAERELEAMHGGAPETFESVRPADDEDIASAELTAETVDDQVEYATQQDMKLGSGRVKRSVIVEANLTKDGDLAVASARTDRNGHFIFNLPEYYDSAILFVKAYNPADSASKNLAARDPQFANERVFPDYFVKRDMIFPIYSQPYSWYQMNSPELQFFDEDDENIPENSKLAGDHRLQTVIVKARRRGKRRIDMDKPALVRDIYQIYNDISDYGLMLGVYDAKRMPVAVATYLCGNMGRRNMFNIRAMVNGTSFYRNYIPTGNEYDKPATSLAVFQNTMLTNLKDIRAYTDYELRTDSGAVVETNSPDITLEFVPMPEGSKRYTYRDRRYVLDGIAYPEEYYSPDYSKAIPKEPKDYRRTLYWNPNAKPEADGRFTTTLYNNCRETRVTVSACGIDTEGHAYYNN